MTKRIFRSILLVAALVLLASFTFIIGVLYDYFSSVQKEHLKTQMSFLIDVVDREGETFFDSLDESDKERDYRITWINSDGVVLFDSKKNSNEMENHSDRKEFISAIKTGTGESSRYSTTLTEKTFYLANRMSDGTILRISTTQYSILTLILGMIHPIFIVFIIAIILSIILANRLSKRIVEPLNSINLDKPLENETYDELSPLLTRIEQQYNQIDAQLSKLKRKQCEFNTVTSSMKEGLLLLNDKGIILSINPAAQVFFGTDHRCIGNDLVVVDRSRDVIHAFNEALSGGKSEIRIIHDGKEYQLNASRIETDGHISGVVMLTFDITDKTFAERNRREFTANVSHELKTPLQSIMGIAEIIENGFVKPEDMSRFIGKIRSESARLLTLIEDIIRLSQLDEGGEMPLETVNIFEMTDEIIESLKQTADSKNVSISLEGKPIKLKGVHRVLYEMIYNLCENAIKYNVDGGKVDISILESNNKVILDVSDTGIGIPKEYSERVFERFFRVDKSHSKETGGTGLGLSIVKHTAQFLGAEIELESEVGKGTTIKVIFPV